MRVKTSRIDRGSVTVDSSAKQAYFQLGALGAAEFRSGKRADFGSIVAKIYTRTGDDGTTGLIGGRRAPKDSLRIGAYGAIDELNALLGVVRSYGIGSELDQLLQRLQDELFSVGANLALPEGADRAKWSIPAIGEECVAALEEQIDRCEARLQPLRKFILPGGSSAGALMHLARTVARRAERRCVALSHAESVDPAIVRYLNRLSDLCFVLARLINQEAGCPEAHPSYR
jgi:cob(I)alamin adenosyltransferase